ncbi:MAG: hypothetical protein CMM02_16090 [Rhodopirellula sp.]|nr:hypothetical protein [Rhodopirellula sp.]
MTIRPFLPMVFILLLSCHARAVEPEQTRVQSFLSSHCLRCHGLKSQKADRRFDQLDFSNIGLTDAGLLQDIVDQLNLGTMPPEGEAQPSASEIQQAVASLTSSLAKLREETRRTSGNVVLRRLNRIEYRNTIRDLFDLEMTGFDPTVTFPADSVTDGFDNVGEGLVTSDYLLQNYLDSARTIAMKVIRPGPRPQIVHYGIGGQFSSAPASAISTPDKDGRIDSGRLFIKFRQPLVIPDLNKSGVPADGEYAITFTACAVRRQSRYKDEDLRYDSSQPMRLSISIQSRELGPTSQSIVAEYEIPDDRSVEIEHRLWLQKGFTISVHWANGPEGSFKRIMRKVLPKYNPDALLLARNPPEMYVGSGPELHVKSLEIEGPFYKDWPPKGFSRYFPDPPQSPELDYLDQSLLRLASEAFRRPVNHEEIESYTTLTRNHYDKYGDYWNAARYGVQALLTSPHFLYLVEPETTDREELASDFRLTQHELATRLSYFLWSSMPDRALRSEADRGTLNNPKVIRAHVERMLLNDKASAFVDNFTGQWLNLRKLGTMPPDPEKNREYYANNLEDAMRRETELYFSHILQQNRSILEFIDSDYTFLNSALATHYGIPFEEGDSFRKVLIPESTVRGGLLGHGSILTSTSNGVETLPVTRGIWVLENLLGVHPNPPPPDIEPLEPDTRGVTTIREMMEKHRKIATCYECHRKIDPFGLALENYDHLGSWRSIYSKGLSIDSSVQLSEGTILKGPTGIKEYILARPDQFTRCLTEKLLVYALGRRLSFTDRADIDRVVKQLPKHNYSLRQLIHFIVASRAFNSK